MDANDFVSKKLTITRLYWQNCWHIVPSRFPDFQPFEHMVQSEDLQAINELSALTDDFARASAGVIHLMSGPDRLGNECCRIVSQAFTHPNPDGSRFNDGQLGVFYAAKALATAIAETRVHLARFLRATQQGPMELDMRAYQVDLQAELYDLRGQHQRLAEFYDPNDQRPTQQLSTALQQQQANGIAFDSLQASGGECAAIFRPHVLSNCRSERHLCFIWDGERIETVYEKQLLEY